MSNILKTGLNPEIQKLKGQVMANCHRSDARYAGSFSLCGLLLRLRDFFRWENNLWPWSDVDSEKVLTWIEERETLWEGLDEDPQPLLWNGRELDPFESDGLNDDLAEQNLYYGSGYAAFLKPSFILAQTMRREKVDGYQVIYLERELARDLFTVPAQTQGKVILARKRPLAAYLWDTILHAGGPRRTAMDAAVAEYGLSRSDLETQPQGWLERFHKLLDDELESAVSHELGEIRDEVFPKETWRSIVGSYPHTRIELLARTIKDMLADTGDGGRLRFLIQGTRLASLAIYTAQLDGLAEKMFPEMEAAFTTLLKNSDWQAVENARTAALNRTISMAEELIFLVGRDENQGKRLIDDVNERLFKPLGL